MRFVGHRLEKGLMWQEASSTTDVDNSTRVKQSPFGAKSVQHNTGRVLDTLLHTHRTNQIMNLKISICIPSTMQVDTCVIITTQP